MQKQRLLPGNIRWHFLGAPSASSAINFDTDSNPNPDDNNKLTLYEKGCYSNMNNKILWKITIIAGVFSALCLIGYYLALHDILKDYASPKIIQEQIAGAPALPEWTTCSLEWEIVKKGYWCILLFHVLFIIDLFKRKSQKGI